MITIPALSPMSTTEALPTTTPAPASSHKAAPYAHMTAGGYSIMACGYGYKKDDKGYCRPESWVSLIMKLYHQYLGFANTEVALV